MMGFRIEKIRGSCLAEFDAHWQCLEKNNQVSSSVNTLSLPASDLV